MMCPLCMTGTLVALGSAGALGGWSLRIMRKQRARCRGSKRAARRPRTLEQHR
jgi:hypothetical protein